MRGGEAGGVAVRLDLAAGAAMGEDVADLADRDDGPAGRASSVSRRCPTAGGVAKSRRLAGAREARVREPTNGRAMTRPIR